MVMAAVTETLIRTYKLKISFTLIRNYILLFHMLVLCHQYVLRFKINKIQKMAVCVSIIGKEDVSKQNKFVL